MRCAIVVSPLQHHLESGLWDGFFLGQIVRCLTDRLGFVSYVDPIEEVIC